MANHNKLLSQAALSGAYNHPALPRIPEELAAEAQAAAESGAQSLHLHPLMSKATNHLRADCGHLPEPVFFAESGIAPTCKRAMVEPLNTDPNEAVALATAIEQLLADNHIHIEQVHHGDRMTSWSVNRRAVERGHSIRTGLEDTLMDVSNGELVAAALIGIRCACSK